MTALRSMLSERKSCEQRRAPQTASLFCVPEEERRRKGQESYQDDGLVFAAVGCELQIGGVCVDMLICSVDFDVVVPAADSDCGDVRTAGHPLRGVVVRNRV
jgi:hypothetical protein